LQIYKEDQKSYFYEFLGIFSPDIFYSLKKTKHIKQKLKKLILVMRLTIL